MSTPDIYIAPSTQADALALAAVMRPEDVAEIEAAGGLTPLQALEAGLKSPDWCSSVFFDGEIAAMCGVAPYKVDEGLKVGIAWALTGTAVAKHKRDFLRISRLHIQRMLLQYDVLWNAVDNRYRGALRWLEWLGFKLSEPVAFGKAQLPFRFAVLRRAHG